MLFGLHGFAHFVQMLFIAFYLPLLLFFFSLLFLYLPLVKVQAFLIFATEEAVYFGHAYSLLLLYSLRPHLK